MAVPENKAERKKEMTKYFKCSISKLSYEDKTLADKCYNWCKKHKSCNLQITIHSLERGSIKD